MGPKSVGPPTVTLSKGCPRLYPYVNEYNTLVKEMYTNIVDAQGRDLIDRWTGVPHLVRDWTSKTLIFWMKTQHKNVFCKILCLLLQHGKQETAAIFKSRECTDAFKAIFSILAKKGRKFSNLLEVYQ